MRPYCWSCGDTGQVLADDLGGYVDCACTDPDCEEWNEEEPA